MTYLDVWRSGTFLLYSCKVAFWIQETSPRLCDVECSVILWSVFAIGSALAHLLFFRECATPPYVQVRHTTWLSFTRPSPALVLQATNAGAWSPGYEARVKDMLLYSVYSPHSTTHLQNPNIPPSLSVLSLPPLPPPLHAHPSPLLRNQSSTSCVGGASWRMDPIIRLWRSSWKLWNIHPTTRRYVDHDCSALGFRTLMLLLCVDGSRHSCTEGVNW